MAVTAFALGTQTAVINTEHFLTNVNKAGVYTFHVDLVNMASGDTLELRIYQMILTGGTARVVYEQTFTGAALADSTIAISYPISNELTDTNSLRFSLKQTAGTGKDYPWKVLKHA